MNNLIIPEKVTIQLVDRRGNPMQMGNVIFTVHLFARHKNDFFLSPYFSDEKGLVTITKTDFQHEVDATYDSGLMDYVSVETCYPKVEIYTNSSKDISRALESRENVWTNLLKGEKERWESMEVLLGVYRNSNNHKISLLNRTHKIQANWNGTEEFEYTYKI